LMSRPVRGCHLLFSRSGRSTLGKPPALGYSYELGRAAPLTSRTQQSQQPP
jgi:hypothetical protein